MTDLSQRPLAYLVRVGTTTSDAGLPDYPLDAEGLAQAEEVVRFLSFEPTGRIVSSDRMAAIQTANIIFVAESSLASMVEIEPIGAGNGVDGTERVLALLAQPEMGLPMVIVGIDMTALRARLAPDQSGELVAPGGIAAVYREGEGSLRLEPRMLAIIAAQELSVC